MKIIKLFISAVLATAICNNAYADHILLRNGKSLEVYNIEVSDRYIFYNESDKDDASIKKINRDEVFALKIGDNDIIPLDTHAATTSLNSNENRNSSPTAASTNNDSLKGQYSSSEYTFTKNEKNKAARSVILIYGLTDDSVISTADLEVSFESGWFDRKTWYNLDSDKRKKVWAFSTQVKITLTNKTDKPIYVDLTRSYRNGNLAGYRAFFDGTQTASAGGSASGTGIGIGPVHMGASEFNGKTISKGQLPVISIPPKGSITLPPYQVLAKNNEIYDRYDSFSSMNGKEVAAAFEGLNEYGVKSFDESSSPVNVYYSIVYSKDHDLTESNDLNFKFYSKQAIGIPPLVQYFPLIKGRDSLNEITDVDSKTILGSINLEEISPTSEKGQCYSRFEQLSLIEGGW